jgi:hypothetical protein
MAATTTVSMVPRSTAFFSWSNVRLPGMSGFLLGCARQGELQKAQTL